MIKRSNPRVALTELFKRHFGPLSYLPSLGTARRVTYVPRFVPLSLGFAQPLCNSMRVKPHACADTEGRDTSCFSLFENRDSRNAQQVGEFDGCQSVRSLFDYVSKRCGLCLVICCGWFGHGQVPIRCLVWDCGVLNPLGFWVSSEQAKQDSKVVVRVQ